MYPFVFQVVKIYQQGKDVRSTAQSEHWRNQDCQSCGPIFFLKKEGNEWCLIIRCKMYNRDAVK